MRAQKPLLVALLMSGFTDEESHDLARRAGFAGFVRKPYRPQELVDRVREALARATPSSSLLATPPGP